MLGAVLQCMVAGLAAALALMLLAELQQEGLAPNSITFSTALSACEKLEQPH